MQPWVDNSRFTHENNIYYFIEGNGPNFELGLGEIVADPLFVDLDGQDLHLQPESPAIDAGGDLGYTLDFDDQTIPQGDGFDIGAYEFSTTPTVASTRYVPVRLPDAAELSVFTLDGRLLRRALFADHGKQILWNGASAGCAVYCRTAGRERVAGMGISTGSNHPWSTDPRHP
jgi:hypothetical protein